MGLTLLLGGQKSGKSSAAARIAAAAALPVVVIAPAVATDGEFEARIARHRADRPSDWRLVETFAVAATLADPAHTGVTVIVDALDTWLFDAMGRHGLLPADDHLDGPDPGSWRAVLAEVAAIADAAASRAGRTLLIAGVPGWGPIGATPLVRWYVDLHGLACRQLADRADRCLLIVAGRALDLGALDNVIGHPLDGDPT